MRNATDPVGYWCTVARLRIGSAVARAVPLGSDSFRCPDKYPDILLYVVIPRYLVPLVVGPVRPESPSGTQWSAGGAERRTVRPTPMVSVEAVLGKGQGVNPIVEGLATW